MTCFRAQRLWMPMSASKPVALRIDGLVAGYGGRRVLNEVSLEVCKGEVVALIGHNGAGKTTLLRTVFGLLTAWEGCVTLHGVDFGNSTPRILLEQGVAYVPQGNRVFPDLSVLENLEAGGTILEKGPMLKEGIERALDLFPVLRARLRQRAGALSGGEKQMLALANVLVLRPRLLLLDEPSMGLSPRLVTVALARIRQIAQDWELACLVVEQKVRDVLRIADRTYVLRNGFVSYTGPSVDLFDENKLREAYL